jgi:hypothetical protein
MGMSCFSKRTARANYDAYHTMPQQNSLPQPMAQLSSWTIKRMGGRVFASIMRPMVTNGIAQCASSHFATFTFTAWEPMQKRTSWRTTMTRVNVASSQIKTSVGH